MTRDAEPKVSLRTFIDSIAKAFDRTAPMSAPAQRILRRAPRALRDLAPLGFLIVGSGGAGLPARVPWFGFLDPDETTSPLEGLYVVYLFSGDLDTVTLTLIQGITKMLDRVRPQAKARDRLAADGQRIREGLREDLIASLATSINLRAGGRLPAGYEAGAIVAIEYATGALPSEERLR